MAPLLGCIADDFTGATDLASMLVTFGMRTAVLLDSPGGEPPREVDALVVALKSRTAPVAEAITTSLGALAWLRAAGCQRIFFKYCSTFDSTPQGNIGPVAEALMTALSTDFTLACPAFPDNRRTVYQGHLFVGPDLLSDSGMRHHPLTPMTDANLLRVLGGQTTSRVGLIDFDTVRRGPDAVRRRMAVLRAEGVSFAVADAVANQDLDCLGQAGGDLALLTGGSGLARGLPAHFRAAGLLPERNDADALSPTGETCVVLSGSCSVATRGQVAAMAAVRPAFKLDFTALSEGEALSEAVGWARERLGRDPILIYSSTDPAEVRAMQDRHPGIGALVEATLAAIARTLVEDLGVRRLVVAGGETSGAVVQALGVRRLRIGPEICPGVPWTTGDARDGSLLALALKSGNFGAPDFFLTAWRALAPDRPAAQHPAPRVIRTGADHT